MFSGDLQNLTFPEIKILIHTVTDYYFVYVFPKTVDDELISEMTAKAEGKFREKYEKNIDLFKRSEEQFEEFVNDMVDLGFLPKNRIQSTKHYFVTEEETSAEKHESLVERFKQKFQSLVKR